MRYPTNIGETSMLGHLIRHLSVEMHARLDGTLVLTTFDTRLDTTTVYTGSREQGISSLIVRAYADFRAEYDDAIIA